MFLSNPKPEDFLVNSRLRLVDYSTRVKPRLNGYYWFLTGDTLNHVSREIRKVNYGQMYENPAFYSSAFYFHKNGHFYNPSNILAGNPKDFYFRYLKNMLYFNNFYWCGYYAVSDSLEMEYVRIEVQLAKKYYYEYSARLSPNADTLFVHYVRSRDGKFIRKLNAVCVFYPFPDTLN